ncbi:MAG: DUF1080 domain-containing protein [Bacteroidales bacterium]
MKLFLRMFLIVLFVHLISCNGQESEEVTDTPVSGIEDFAGHWSFDIDGGWVGWLGVTREEGYLDAELLWKWGSVTPVAHVFLAGDGVLYVTRTSSLRRGEPAEGDSPRVHTVTNWMEAETDGANISGYFLEPGSEGLGVDSTWFEGVKLPDVPDAPEMADLQFGEPVELFSGTDLTGWELIDENRVNGWKAVDGVLMNDARQVPGEPRISYGNLRTVEEFEDFNLTLEVNVPEGSNSGVYLRGMYEIQILDSYGREPDSHNMGALYSRITPGVAAERPAGVWQTMDITLADRHLTVILNGETIIDNEPVYGPTGGALQSDVFAPGPIFLQGDHGPVSYRNMVLTPVIN